MRSVIKSYHFVFGVALLFGACTAAPPDLTFDAATMEVQEVPAAPPEGCPAVDLDTRVLSLDAPQESHQLSQPVRGTAMGAQDVFARVGAEASTLTRVGSDGRFCLDVPLTPDSQNAIEVIPRTENGCWGQTAQATVTHRSQPTTPNIPQPTTVNAALYKNVQVSQGHLSAGSDPTFITDGQSGTFAEVRIFDPFSTRFAWVMVDLAGSHVLSQIIIEWGPGSTTQQARKYAVLVSDDAAPGSPDPSSNQTSWSTVSAQDFADGDVSGFGTQVVPVGARPARWVALALYLDAGVGLHEVFHVAQIQALTFQTP